ncbi:MAG: lactate utilization protein [Veillonellales bacterium]
MQKVCENWEQNLPNGKSGGKYFADFEARAKKASTEIFHVKNAAEAKQVVTDLLKSIQAKKVVAVDGPYQQASGIFQAIQSMGIELYTANTDIAEHAKTADIGISSVEFGVAETGSVAYDGYSVESRLVSMLPPIHLVFMNSSNIVPGVEEAFEVFSKVFKRGYTGFLTGPSRTADIERVLTIGVHGPSRFILIAVDEEVI